MAIVKKYRSKVISIFNPIEGLYTLEFKSLDGPFKYSPGQFLHLAIDADYDGTGQWPESRCFSMQSSPKEDNIRITYSVKGFFTNQLKKSLKIGDIVWLKLPYGELFNSNHSKVNTVFIAGGTGVSPFLSLFNDKAFDLYINPIIFIGFRSKRFNIYDTDLNNLSKSKETFLKIFYEDEIGIIDLNLIPRFINPIQSFFISGPPTMISFFISQLELKGIDKSQIITDNWDS